MIKVEIDSRFDGDAFVRGILEDIAQEVRGRLQGFQCAEHGGPPVVRLSAEDSGEVVISVGGCCDSLLPEVEKALAGMT